MMHPPWRGRSEPKVGRGGDHLPRLRRGPSPGVGRGGDLLLRPRPKVGRGGDHPPRPRLRPSPGGRARRRFLLRLRLNLTIVSFALAGGTAVGARRAVLFSCQVGQWKGEVTAVTSTLPTEARVSG
jgi:hypothetical protein